MRPRKFVRSTALVLVLTAALTVTAFAADPTQQPATKTDNKSSYLSTTACRCIAEKAQKIFDDIPDGYIIIAVIYWTNCMHAGILISSAKALKPVLGFQRPFLFSNQGAY